MSAPITRRLRERADIYANRIESAASLECEAADIIEALLDALHEALGALQFEGVCGDDCHACVKARAAIDRAQK